MPSFSGLSGKVRLEGGCPFSRCFKGRCMATQNFSFPAMVGNHHLVTVGLLLPPLEYSHNLYHALHLAILLGCHEDYTVFLATFPADVCAHPPPAVVSQITNKDYMNLIPRK